MTANPTRRNVLLLAICQALGMSAVALSMTVASLVGLELAPQPYLATLPLGLHYLASLLATLPASHLMRHVGRRAGFSFGASLGFLAGLLSAWGIAQGSFEIFCAGTFLLGTFNGHVVFYRFAAADTATAMERGRAISLVLAGGLAAAFLGPELAKHSRQLFDWGDFAGGYLSISLLAGLSILVLQFLRIPRPQLPHGRAKGEGQRPLLQIMRQPKFLVAVACGMVGYGAMNIIMVSTPLAMVGGGHHFDHAASVIQWHIVGMYLPSFFTGRWIQRFGLYRILGTGALLILACVATTWSGSGFIQYWSALVLLGVGWNFLYVGGSALLTETYRPEEMAKTQGINDFCVSGLTAITALSSGAIFATVGWGGLTAVVVAPLILVFLAILWAGQAAAKAARSAG